MARGCCSITGVWVGDVPASEEYLNSLAVRTGLATGRIFHVDVDFDAAHLAAAADPERWSPA